MKRLLLSILALCSLAYTNGVYAQDEELLTYVGQAGIRDRAAFLSSYWSCDAEYQYKIENGKRLKHGNAHYSGYTSTIKVLGDISRDSNCSFDVYGHYENNKRTGTWTMECDGWKETGNYVNNKRDGRWTIEKKRPYYNRETGTREEKSEEFVVANFKNGVFVGDIYYKISDFYFNEKDWRSAVLKGQFSDNGDRIGEWTIDVYSGYLGRFTETYNFDNNGRLISYKMSKDSGDFIKVTSAGIERWPEDTNLKTRIKPEDMRASRRAAASNILDVFYKSKPLYLIENGLYGDGGIGTALFWTDSFVPMRSESDNEDAPIFYVYY